MQALAFSCVPLPKLVLDQTGRILCQLPCKLLASLPQTTIRPACRAGTRAALAVARARGTERAAARDPRRARQQHRRRRAQGSDSQSQEAARE